MKATPAQAVDARALRDVLAVRYQRPEWHLEHEVTYQNKRLDSVAFRLWGGGRVGYAVLGFELKVSRADWLRELRAIDKAAAWAGAVDRFYVVAPREVVHLDELPKGWGLLELRGTALRLRAHPADTENATTIPREISARLLDRVSRSLHAREVGVTTAAMAELRAAVAREFTEEQAARDAETAEKVARYDALMREAGLGRHDDPAEVLRRARDVVRVMERLPLGWSWRAATTRLTELTAQLVLEGEKLQAVSSAFRERNQGAAV